MFTKQEDYLRHRDEFHPYSLETEPPKQVNFDASISFLIHTFQLDDTLFVCQLCDEKFTDRSKYNSHIEDIHMVWISPNDESPETESSDCPIIPFSSMLDQV